MKVLILLAMAKVVSGGVWGPSLQLKRLQKATPPSALVPRIGTSGIEAAAVFRGGASEGSIWWQRFFGDSLVRGARRRVIEGRSRTSPIDMRLEKEYSAVLSNPPCNCSLVVGKTVRDWTIEFTGVVGSAYEGETYKLKMIFPKEYPSKPPRVYFLKPTPVHQHVYSNGDICLNLLGSDWRPNLTAETLIISIISMLSSAKDKKLPTDNSLHAGSQPGDQLNWMYHDDNC